MSASDGATTSVEPIAVGSIGRARAAPAGGRRPRRSSTRSRRRCGVARQRPTSRRACGGGLRSHSRNVSCGSHADTTIGAVISVPSSSVDAAHGLAVARDRRRPALPCAPSPPKPSNAARSAAGTMPLPPTGRPTRADVAHRVRQRAEPGAGQLGARCPTPSARSPRPGPSSASLRKNWRSTSAALRRLQRSSVRHAAAVVADARLRVRPPADGGSFGRVEDQPHGRAAPP